MPVTAQRFQEILQAALQALADDDDCCPAADLGILDVAIDLTGVRVRTFEEAGVLTSNMGVVASWPNGREFQVTVVQSKGPHS